MFTGVIVLSVFFGFNKLFVVHMFLNEVKKKPHKPQYSTITVFLLTADQNHVFHQTLFQCFVYGTVV